MPNPAVLSTLACCLLFVPPKATAVPKSSAPKPSATKASSIPRPSTRRAVGNKTVTRQMKRQVQQAKTRYTKTSQVDRQQLMRVGLDPQAAAQTVATLREYAVGGRGAVAQVAGKDRRLRKAAQRIIRRIDALPAARRKAVFGTADTKATATNKALMKGYGSIGTALPLTTKTITLAAQKIPAPDKYTVNINGVHATSNAEADGQDELVAVAALFQTGYQGYYPMVVASTSNPTLDLAPGQTSTASTLLADASTMSTGGALVSGMFEADGNGANLRAEFEVMLALAQGLAEQLVPPGSNSDVYNAKLLFALDYSVGMLSISDPDSWGPGAVVVTPMGPKEGENSLHALYTGEPATEHGVEHRLVHEHSIGSGAYSMYFDVPSPVINQPNVKVRIDKIQVTAGADAGADQDDLTIKVGIGPNGSVTHTLPYDRDTHYSPLIVQRRMSDGSFTIGVSLSEYTAGPEKGIVSSGWGGFGTCDGNCPPVISEMDLTPKDDENWGIGVLEDRRVYFDLDVASGTISGMVSGQAGTKLVLEGTQAPKARVELTVFIED